MKPDATNLEVEDRQAKVISFYCRGMTQIEIAKALDVDQSTISRDLRQIRRRARARVEDYITKDTPFEYYRCVHAIDEIAKKAWQVTDREDATNKERLAALSLLMNCCEKRLEALFGKGPDPGMNNAHDQILRIAYDEMRAKERREKEKHSKMGGRTDHGQK
jgi:transcriptional regulator